MTHPILAHAFAEDYQRDRRTAAVRLRLATLAACCRPSWLVDIAATARGRVARTGRRSEVCCA